MGKGGAGARRYTPGMEEPHVASTDADAVTTDVALTPEV
jgi:hypothetical protein